MSNMCPYLGDDLELGLPLPNMGNSFLPVKDLVPTDHNLFHLPQVLTHPFYQIVFNNNITDANMTTLDNMRILIFEKTYW